MSDDFDVQLVEAGFTLLAGDPDLVVVRGVVPPGLRPPYVVVYATVEWPAAAPANSLDGLATSPTVRWYCHCVGETDESAIAVGQKVRVQLLNQRPAVVGLGVGLIRMEAGGGPPQRDEHAGRAPRLKQIVVYRAGAAS